MFSFISGGKKKNQSGSSKLSHTMASLSGGKMASVIGDGTSQLSRSVAGFKKVATLTLCDQIVADTENVAMTVKADQMTIFLQLLEDEDVVVRRKAMAALYVLVTNPANQEAMAAGGSIKPVVRLLNDVDPEIKQKAGMVLWALAFENLVNSTAIAATGAIPLLVRLLNDANASIAASVLCCLATNNPANQAAIAAAGGIPLLVRLLDDTDLKKDAAEAIWYLVKDHPANQLIIVNGGALPIFELLFCTEDDADTKNFAKATIDACQIHVKARKHKQEPVKPAQEKKQAAQPAGQQRVQLTASTPAQTYQDSFDPFNSSTMDFEWSATNTKTTSNFDHWTDDFSTFTPTLPFSENKVAITPLAPPLNLLTQTYPDPFGDFKAPAAWATTTSKASTDNWASNFTASPPPVSDPFAAFDDIFSVPSSSKTTTHTSSNWASELSDSAATMPSSLSAMQISSNLTTIPSDALVIQRELGRGGFGVVCEALWQGTRVAIKQLIGQLTPALLNEFQRETEVHARLRHTNIITLYGVCIEPMKYALVMEFMARGSLYDVLKNPEELPWSLRLNMSLDMISGLLYLHTQDIIHRDLKSLNILVDDHMRAKIADFGLAKIKLTTATMTKSAGGTPHWMAPELFDSTVSSKATDVYAAGIVLWEVAARKLPYEGKNASQIMRTVDKGNRETIPEGTPPQFGVLISRCWAQRAYDRPLIDVVAREIREIHSGDHRIPQNSQPEIKAAAVDSGYAAFSRR